MLGIDDGPSYLPRGTIVHLTEEDQLPGYRPIWMRVYQVPLTFQRHRETGRRWAWVKGRQLTNDGTPLDQVETPVWLSALPLHEPAVADPVLCARCDPPDKWPCPPARARMLADYEGNRAGLCHYLARHLSGANWHDQLETPRETYHRIVGWTWEEPARAVLGG